MKKLLNLMITFSLCLLTVQGKCQTTYVDPFVTAAMSLYALGNKEAQDAIAEEESNLMQAQTTVSLGLQAINRVQDKVYRGLKEVSGTLQNGLQIAKILSDLEKCGDYSLDITQLIATHPQFAPFGTSATQQAYRQVIKLGTEASELLQSDDLNLATAGDRYRLLDNIGHNVVMLKIWLLQIKLDIERAARIGFWQMINPFQGYINTDKDIVENIMTQFQNQW